MKFLLGTALSLLCASQGYAQTNPNCKEVAVEAAIQLWTFNNDNYQGMRPAVMPGPLETEIKTLAIKPQSESRKIEYNVTLSNIQSSGSYNVWIVSSEVGCFVSSIRTAR